MRCDPKPGCCNTGHGVPHEEVAHGAVDAAVVSKPGLQLTAPDAATKLRDLAAPGWRLHSLTGELRGFHSITANGHWHLIFRFVGQDVELVDGLNYH